MDATGPRAFLTAEWRHLVLVNYEAPAHLLEPLVPRGTELDRHRGRVFVSLVGFRFIDTAVLGCRVPGHVDFDEINLRFYVRREAAGELRRAVTFVKEIVPRRAMRLTTSPTSRCRCTAKFGPGTRMPPPTPCTGGAAGPAITAWRSWRVACRCYRQQTRTNRSSPSITGAKHVRRTAAPSSITSCTRPGLCAARPPCR
jgi:hypothetical protein